MFIHTILTPPTLFSWGPIAIHWYAVMYIIGLFIGRVLATYRAKNVVRDWNSDNIDDLFLYVMLGIMLGGRVGEMLFYNIDYLWTYPTSLFYIWHGGMSFHGALLGVLIAAYYGGKRFNTSFLSVTDFLAPLTPPGLALGRLGNFINGELWGRPTTAPWGVIFMQSDFQPRHPSQLYEMALEGILLFIVLWSFAKKPRPTGLLSGIFATGYATARFGVEFFREPGANIGFIAFGWLTMGQLLSLPLLIIGIGLIFNAYRYGSTVEAG